MGVLGDSNPEQLLNTLIYLLGVHLTLQGIQEHKDLKVSAYHQIIVKYDEELDCKHLHYAPTHIKNHQGGLRDKNKKTKEVKAFANKNNLQRFVV